MSSKKLNYILIGIVILLIAYILFDNYCLDRLAIKRVNADMTEKLKTIAVLPFVNMSSEPNQEYFVDGLSEEILNTLAQIPDLHVIARTASFAFKGSNKTLQEIANTLGVENILEGSVRKAGDSLRITATMICAADGLHLWSKTYDRDLKDIFEVQEDIAKTVSDKLKVSLGVDYSFRALGGTNNVKAYELYLIALGQTREATSIEEFDSASKSLEAAIALDPEFIPVWTLLSYNVHDGLITEASDSDINRLASIYSTQRIVALNVNETFTFQIKNGDKHVIKLISIREYRDSVIDFMQRAEVRIEIDNKPFDFVCEPYTMPVEIAGMRLLVDTTSGWGNLTKDAQISIWDAEDPIVNAKIFGFPLNDFRFLSHGTQGYNEPVYLGVGDGQPAGIRNYHDYGFDIAGYEGGEEVISATDGKVIGFWPSLEDLCSVLLEDTAGFCWEYAHLKSIEPDIILDAHVTKGQKIGILGKTGPSGNFSHLHLGSFISSHDSDMSNYNTRLNLYPWLIAVYQAQHPKGLLAVARPHHMALTGEIVVFDGSHSLAWGGNKIVEWRWVFSDGQTFKQIKTEKVFNKPGVYIAALWVKDDKGSEDVDFCQVKVFSKTNPEKNIPHIFMTYTPTMDIRPDQPVRFRFWMQGKTGGPIQVEFDDGTLMKDYKQDSEFTHSFKKPGIHIVTAQCEIEGKPIMQKLKVVVEPSVP